MSQENIINCINDIESKKIKKMFADISAYVAELEERNKKLQAIVANPEEEIHKAREELRSAQLKFQIDKNWCVTAQERATGLSWIKKHYETNKDHRDEDLDYEFVLYDTAIDMMVECRCRKCGARKFCN